MTLFSKLFHKNYKECNQDDFVISFLKQENEEENMVYSPLSIKYVLKMLESGADGNTKAQIKALIKNNELVNYKNIANIFNMANGLYINNKMRDLTSQYYINLLRKKYGAEVNFDDFSNPDNINKWIEKKTLGILKNVLSCEDINEVTSMVLINALAVNLKWKDKFDPDYTYHLPFYTETGEEITVLTMSKTSDVSRDSYYEDADMLAVAMDLENVSDFEFVAIMPQNGLHDYIKNFSLKDFEFLRKKFISIRDNHQDVQILIPKFSINYELKLQDDLKNQGMTDAFDREKANFSGISSDYQNNYWVKKILHKASIDVVECGIKAASTTVVSGVDGCAMPRIRERIVIKINKPFFFFIRNKNNGEIIFTGTVYKPQTRD